MDRYAQLASYYDIENAELVEDLPVYGTLAEERGGPILDVGCGTGRVTFYLARLGYGVVGLDTSEAMLERARHKLEKQSFGPEQVALLHIDVAQLALEERFKLAIFAYHGFMHLTTRAEQLAALTTIRKHLSADGVLALDLPNPLEAFAAEDSTALVLERVFEDPSTGETVMQQSVASLDRAAQLMDVTWIYDRVAANGSVTRTVVPLVLRYTFLAEMELLLERAGLRLRDVYGDYDFGPYQETSSRMLVVAAVDGP